MSYPQYQPKPGPYNQYPPETRFYDPSTSTSQAPSYHTNPDDARRISRTPSPTPSELKELKTGAFDWDTLKNWRFWIRREWLWYYVALAIILILTALMTIYHEQIVDWLHPAATWLHDLSFGWLVPIGILFVISFPPLFGHEIVAVLCGLVWGLWIGFGIVAAGTFLGEIGNFYAFKYCCRARGEKLERTKITYACLAKVVRDGGFKIALIARLSAIPGHFTTAVFSTCGMGIIVFSLAALLSLPKQFITVYLGVILKQSADGTKDTKSKIISDVVLAITFLVTVVAMWYIYRQMNKVKPAVIYERRKARQAKMERAYGSGPYNMNDPEAASSSTTVFNPRTSDSEIPLTAQQWDKDGKAVGFSGDTRLDISQPQPKRYPHAYAPRQSVDVGWDMGAQPHLQGGSAQQLYDPPSQPNPYAPIPPQLAGQGYQISPLPPRISSPAPRSPITMSGYQSRQNSIQHPQSPPAQPWQSNNPYSPRRTSFEVSQTPTQAQFVSHSTGYSPQISSSQPPQSVTGGPRVASPRTSTPASPISGALPMPAFPASPTVHVSGSPQIAPSLSSANMGNPPAYQSTVDLGSSQQPQFSSHRQEATDASDMSFHTAVGHSREPTAADGYNGYSAGGGR